jgi:RND superfamily putative drug exporter
MFEILGKIVVSRKGIGLILAWIAVSVLIFAFAPSLESIQRDDNVGFFPKHYPTVLGDDLLQRGFGADRASSQMVVAVERAGGPLVKADYAFADKLAAALSKFRDDNPQWGLKALVSYKTPIIGPRLIGTATEADKPAGQTVLIIQPLESTFIARKTRQALDLLIELVDRESIAAPEGVRVGMTGSAMVGHDLNQAANSSLDATTVATIVLVLAILLIVYRSPLLALVPLVTIGFSVVVAIKALPLLTYVPGLNFQVINITSVFVVVVLFGAGTDYCLFLIARYREELIAGLERKAALKRSLEAVGAALIASAGTVIFGLGLLWFCKFAKISYIGPSIGLSLVSALLASVTIAPVLMARLGRWLFWPFAEPGPGEPDPGAGVLARKVDRSSAKAMHYWGRVSDYVVAKPWRVQAACMAGMLPLALVGMYAMPNYSQLDDLSAGQKSVVGTQLIRNYFPIGELSPSSVLIHHPDMDFRSDVGRTMIRQLSLLLASHPGIAEVRSSTQPLGKPAEDVPAAKTTGGLFGGLMANINRTNDRVVNALAESRHVSSRALDEADRGRIARIDLVFDTDPFATSTVLNLQDILRQVQDAARPGGFLEGVDRVGLAGATAEIADLKDVTLSDERLMYVLVSLGVYGILVVLLRQPVVSLYLVATVVVGYLASLGATELVFRVLHEGPGPWGGLDWKVSFFLFVILVAVGEDYNIFLMSRVVEESREHGVVEGTRRAVTHTGGIISSCGLIMAGTLGSMLLGELNSLKQLGFAMALGVLLDTFLVRPILVPSFLVIWGRFLERYRARRLPAEQRPLVAEPHAAMTIDGAAAAKGFSMSPYCPYDGDEPVIVS